MKMFEVPVTKYYVIGGVLENLRSTFYDNQINVYFKCDTMSLNEYLSLIE